MTKLLLDTNLYVDWLNHGRHEALMVGPGFVRHLSSIVQVGSGPSFLSVMS